MGGQTCRLHGPRVHHHRVGGFVEVDPNAGFGPLGLNHTSAVGLFVSESVQAAQGARFGKRRQSSQRREKIWTVDEVHLEGLGFSGHDLNALVSACEATPSKQQRAFDGFVGLGVGAVKAFDVEVMGCTQHAQGHQKSGP